MKILDRVFTPIKNLRTDNNNYLSEYKIKISQCKICHLYKVEWKFKNVDELKLHLLQNHQDNLYRQIALELLK